jgi:hypothetical protein
MQCNKLRIAAGRLLAGGWQAGGCAPAKHDAHCCVGKHAVQQAAYCCRPAAGMLAAARYQSKLRTAAGRISSYTHLLWVPGHFL